MVKQQNSSASPQPRFASYAYDYITITGSNYLNEASLLDTTARLFI